MAFTKLNAICTSYSVPTTHFLFFFYISKLPFSLHTPFVSILKKPSLFPPTPLPGSTFEQLFIRLEIGILQVNLKSTVFFFFFMRIIWKLVNQFDVELTCDCVGVAPKF